MAKKRSKKNQLDLATLKRIAKNNSAVIARIIVALIILGFVIGMQLIYKNTSTNQTFAAPDATVKSICLIESKGCLVKHPAKRKSSTHIIIKRADPQTSSSCLQYQALINKYNSAVSDALTQVNQQADNARSQAQNSGESYQDFDNDLNNIFTSYDNNVTAIYNSFAAQAGNCKSELTPPATFNTFSP